LFSVEKKGFFLWAGYCLDFSGTFPLSATLSQAVDNFRLTAGILFVFSPFHGRYLLPRVVREVCSSHSGNFFRLIPFAVTIYASRLPVTPFYKPFPRLNQWSLSLKGLPHRPRFFFAPQFTFEVRDLGFPSLSSCVIGVRDGGTTVHFLILLGVPHEWTVPSFWLQFGALSCSQKCLPILFFSPFIFPSLRPRRLFPRSLL